MLKNTGSVSDVESTIFCPEKGFSKVFLQSSEEKKFVLILKEEHLHFITLVFTIGQLKMVILKFQFVHPIQKLNFVQP
jgi:hypothetical protein